MNSQIHKIQNLIDESKQELGDGKYLQLCNSMKELYNIKPPEPKTDFIYNEPPISIQHTYENPYSVPPYRFPYPNLNSYKKVIEEFKNEFGLSFTP